MVSLGSQNDIIFAIIQCSKPINIIWKERSAFINTGLAIEKVLLWTFEHHNIFSHRKLIVKKDDIRDEQIFILNL